MFGLTRLPLRPWVDTSILATGGLIVARPRSPAGPGSNPSTSWMVFSRVAPARASFGIACEPLPWVRIPPSPFHILDLQGLQGDFGFQSTDLSTELTLPLRPGDILPFSPSSTPAGAHRPHSLVLLRWVCPNVQRGVTWEELTR